MSEVRGSGRECQAVTAQDSGEELLHVGGQRRQPGGATSSPMPGVAARRSNPMAKEWWLCRRRRA